MRLGVLDRSELERVVLGHVVRVHVGCLHEGILLQSSVSGLREPIAASAHCFGARGIVALEGNETGHSSADVHRGGSIEEVVLLFALLVLATLRQDVGVSWILARDLLRKLAEIACTIRALLPEDLQRALGPIAELPERVLEEWRRAHRP